MMNGFVARRSASAAPRSPLDRKVLITMQRRNYWLVCWIALAPLHFAQAEVRLPEIFTDHMVLQQELPIAVWGFAAADEPVSVALGDATATTKADQSGRWQVSLPAMKADGKPRTLTVRGSNTIELKDVLLGEVWLCSGQSNMGRPVTGEQIAGADCPSIRLFNSSGDTPRRDGLSYPSGWAVCSPETIKVAGDGNPENGRRGFTEVGYVFGRRIHEALDVPVGLIQVNCGGSTAKDWTPTPGVAETLKYDERIEGIKHNPGVLYEVRLKAIVPFTIRGVVWYQGEDDGRNTKYAEDFARLIASWRELWDRPKLPFYYAQIAATTYASGMLRVWEAQQWVMANVPHTGMAVSNDIYEGTTNGGFKLRTDAKTGLPIAGGSNPHPTGKDRIAERLAAIALVETYGRPKQVLYGPMYSSHEIQGDKVLVHFQHVGSGLKTSDGQAPNWFELAGGEQERGMYRYLKAEAKIVDEDTIELRAEGLTAPKHVRFGWHALARFNLINEEGLPAVSFRTDDAQRW
jgi:sialate O-acetylesterase